MTWLTSLPTLTLLSLVILAVGSLTLGVYFLLLTRIGDHRERSGAAAAAYMTALGSLFAILTGFLINVEYTTLRSAQSVVGQEAAAASRLAWATEGLPSVDASLVHERLGMYLSDESTYDWPAFADGKPQASRAFGSLQALQSTVFTVASRSYVTSSAASAMESAVADLTSGRRELISTAGSEMPWELFALSVIAGFALIVNALVVALRSEGKTAYVALGIVVIVALDLALILGIAAPFRGPFVVDRGPVAQISNEVRRGIYLPWVGVNGQVPSTDATCSSDPRGCLTIAAGASIELGTLLQVDDKNVGIGRDAAQGVELAIDYLDAEFDGIPGTLLGHPVEVVHADDQCSPEGGKAGATRLLASPRLVATVGTSCSGAALGAAVPIFAKAGVPLVSAENTAPALTASSDPNGTYARTAPNDLIQGSVVAGFVANELGAKTVAVVSDGSVYSDQLGQVFARRISAMGATALPAIVTPEGSDWNAVARQLVAMQAPVVYMPVNSPVCEDLMGAIATQGVPIQVVTSDACLGSDVLPAATKVKAYASGPDISALDQQPFYSNQYRPAYRSIFGQQPQSVWNPSAFDAASMLFDSVARVAVLHPDGSISIPRSALVRAIRVIDGYRGVSNKMVCTDTGDCAQSATIAVYRAPAWPVGASANDALPVYSKNETLTAVMRT